MTEKVAAHLQVLGITFDRVIASSAARTRETAEIMSANIGSSAPLIVRERLYNATADAFAFAIGQESEEAVTCLGGLGAVFKKRRNGGHERHHTGCCGDGAVGDASGPGCAVDSSRVRAPGRRGRNA